LPIKSLHCGARFSEMFGESVIPRLSECLDAELGKTRVLRQVQGDLFDQQNRERSSRLMRVLDRLNDRMGAGTLRYAV